MLTIMEEHEMNVHMHYVPDGKIGTTTPIVFLIDMLNASWQTILMIIVCNLFRTLNNVQIFCNKLRLFILQNVAIPCPLIQSDKSYRTNNEYNKKKGEM